jgi:hypothetical protein
LSCSRTTTRSNRVRASLTGLVVLAGAAGVLLAPSANAAVGGCTGTGYFQDDHELTAAIIVTTTTPVTGNVDAATCDIGVYFDEDGSVTGATISGAPRYYGILVRTPTAAVTISDAVVDGVGDAQQPSGNQHGVGIAFRDGATGSISDSTVANYQKNGILVRDAGSSVTVAGNTVTGDGPTDSIAQNGIQISYGASGTVSGNTITGDDYTGQTYTACGLLMYQSNGVKTGRNSFSDNQKNVCTVGRGGGNVSAG